MLAVMLVLQLPRGPCRPTNECSEWGGHRVDADKLPPPLLLACTPTLASHTSRS